MNEEDLAALLREHAVRHSVPGAGAGILRDGAVTTACYGVADVRSGVPVTAATRFSAGSLAKSMVATVIAGRGDRLRLPEGLARNEIIAGAGHFTWMDAPDRYWPAVTRFLRSVTAPAAGH